MTKFKNTVIGVMCLTSISLFARPEWIDDTSKVCKKSELCAVGSGISLSMAKVNATSSIAKIFETKVKSTFTTEVTFEGGSETSWGNERIEEATEMALNGVMHPHSYNGKDYYYALAKVKKSKLARIFQKEMDLLAEKMVATSKVKRTGALFELENLYKSWELFSKRYTFLTGIDKSAPLSYKEILERKRNAASDVVIHLYLDEKKPRQLTPHLESILTQIGYTISKGEVMGSDATHLLIGKLKWQKEFLKVKGFEKYKFIFSLDAKNRRHRQSGKMSYSISETGRNFEQAYQKALGHIKNYIVKDLHKISFEKQTI
jgi:hypothetical protein